MPRDAARSAFTLIELLVVISIVTLLVAILLPAIEAARSQAKLVLCRGNLRQLFVGDVIYQADFRQWMPMQDEGEFNFRAYGDTGKFREYWNDQVSWCPTMDHTVAGSMSGAPRWDNRNIYGDTGYYRPKYSNGILTTWLYSYMDGPAKLYVRNPDVQMLESGTNWPPSYAAANPFNVARAVPAAMDILYAYPTLPAYPATPAVQFSTSAHCQGPTIRPFGGWAPPSGANVLWPDGTVEYKPWDPTRDPVTGEWLYIITGQVPYDEGFAFLISTTGLIPYSRRGVRN